MESSVGTDKTSCFYGALQQAVLRVTGATWFLIKSTASNLVIGPKGKEIYDIEATDMGDIKEAKGMKWENRGPV